MVAISEDMVKDGADVSAMIKASEAADSRGDASALLQNAAMAAADEDDGEDDDCLADPSKFAEILGNECIIKRIDKDQKVSGTAKPEDMQRELMSRASIQKRMGACAEHVKGMTQKEKLEWALQLKATGNEFYNNNKFEEAAKLYNDCLVALDFEGSPEENLEVQQKLQLPVCTNLAACLIEMGSYQRCAELCDMALAADPKAAKALYRKGLALYRLGNHKEARPNFEKALIAITEHLEDLKNNSSASSSSSTQEPQSQETTAEEKDPAASLRDLERRVQLYLNHIQRSRIQEKERARKVFASSSKSNLYDDRPGAKPEEEEPEEQEIDDSEEAIEARLQELKGGWCCCSRRRGKAKSS
eukprot:TRINITY_DN23121_c0_g1_i1.p1 TRINITY_DN23121_c0_g1~~TRINITY_DN23121_c0_g1_i1.p1  ORF type:complete len:377 (+),score=103.59 TRINITY_DN23121_c0_g1_i1:56-1132(+)